MSLITRLLGFSFFALSTTVQAAEIPASALTGNLSVSPMGAATYSIPLALPAGVNGATPKLSLEYSSQAGMGIAGMGWNIGGLSAITRCPQSKAVDGVQKALTLTADDRFCMDGQRLILTSGTYGAAGSTYQTEINNFARVTALTHPNNTSLIYFKVDTKDGKVLEYGSRLDAVLQPNVSGKSNFPLVWMISSGYDRDQKGQLIAYDYTNDNANGQQTLSRVRYAYDVNNANNLAEAIFSYNTIPSTPTAAYPLPPITMYMAGGSTSKRDKQLARVTVHSARVAGQPLNEIHNYQLVYEVAPNTRRQRLKEVKSCMPSGNCLPALQFESQNATASVLSAFNAPSNPLAAFGANQTWSNSSVHPRKFADINNDGHVDIVGFSDAGVVVALNNGNGGFNPAQDKLSAFGRVAGGWSNNNPFQRNLVDINGDGLPDIVGFANAGIEVAINNTSGGFNAAYYASSQFGASASAGGYGDDTIYPRQLVDINGDSFPDVVGFGYSGIEIAINNANGGFNAAYNALQAFGLNAGGWSNNNTYPRHLVDVNGDGFPDVVGFSSAGVEVSINNKNGYFGTPYTALQAFGVNAGWSDESTHPRHLVDVNGDGLIDIIGFSNVGVEVSLNNGLGYFSSPINKLSSFGASVSAGSWTNSTPRQLADVNGDGLPDIVGFRDTSVHIALNTGNGFESPVILQNYFSSYPSWSTASIKAVFDVNGDGSDDFVGFADNGVVTALNKDSFQADVIVKFNKTATLGISDDVSYLPLTNNLVYKKKDNVEYYLRFPMYVVSSVNNKILDRDDYTEYFYQNLAYIKNRGLAGFETIRSYNINTKIRTDVAYKPWFPYSGMVVDKRTVFCSTDSCRTYILSSVCLFFCNYQYPYHFPMSVAQITDMSLISVVSNDLDYKILKDASGADKIYFPYIKSSTTKTFEPPVVGQ